MKLKKNLIYYAQKKCYNQLKLSSIMFLDLDCKLKKWLKCQIIISFTFKKIKLKIKGKRSYF